MEIYYLEECDSTQIYLKNLISQGLSNPCLIYTKNQTNGIGSRQNYWTGIKGNLFFSFFLHKSFLPNDLQLQSASIYFSFLFKEILSSLGSRVWVKWPNDFYIDSCKIGGTITNIVGDYLVCGIGLNLVKNESVFKSLDIDIDIEKVLRKYTGIINDYISWKEVFIKYEIEFTNSKKQICHIDGISVDISSATLNQDGSIEINNKKVYSLR